MTPCHNAIDPEETTTDESTGIIIGKTRTLQYTEPGQIINTQNETAYYMVYDRTKVYKSIILKNNQTIESSVPSVPSVPSVSSVPNNKFIGHTGTILIRVTTNYNNTDLLITFSLDDTIRIWNSNTCECLQIIQISASHIYEIIRYSCIINNLFIIWTGNKVMGSWDIESGEYNEIGLFSNMPTHNSCIYADGNNIIYNVGAIVYIINIYTREQKKIVTEHAHFNLFMYERIIDNCIITGSYDGTYITCVTSGKCIRTIEHGVKLICVTTMIGRPGNIIVSYGINDFAIHIWCMESGEIIHFLRDFTYRVSHLKIISSDSESKNNLIVSGGCDCNIRIWDINTGNCLKKIPFAFVTDFDYIYKLSIVDNLIIAHIYNNEVHIFPIIELPAEKKPVRDMIANYSMTPFLDSAILSYLSI